MNNTAQLLQQFIAQHPRLLVLTGAGISTASGIPAYRDRHGQWQLSQPPMQHRDFIQQHRVRQQYWARSLAGWPTIRDAQPGIAHQQLVRLEQQGHIELLITQNVDRLHQRAGSQKVIDLHGRSDQVRCLNCQRCYPRDNIHQQSAALNPDFLRQLSTPAPDGDARLSHHHFDGFQVINCPHCQGILKPDVVFFGDHIPGDRVERGRQALLKADGLLVVGSSLMVYSGFRFCRWAAQQQIPIAALTLGQTRADALLTLKLDACAENTLAALSFPDAST